MKIKLLEPLGVKQEKIDAFSAQITNAGHEFVAYPDRVDNADVLIERSKDADVVMIANMPYRAEVINACNRLKLISVAFTGVDHLDVGLCKEKGITVTNASGYSNIAVAELAFGFMLNLYRNILPCDRAVRNGKTKDGLVGNELFGKTIGVVGCGQIGSRVNALSQAFGFTVLAHILTVNPSLEEIGVTFVTLDELLQKCDIVTLHVPLNDTTKNLIEEKQIARMKPTAILINTARGPIVDSTALANALNNGNIAGAAIDVFETEPPIAAEHPLLNCKNAILTPHVAFATQEALERRADIVFDTVISWLNGEVKNKIV